ncbi:MAG: hypothetical protein ACE5G9_05305 [Nitrospinales bacterium]
MKNNRGSTAYRILIFVAILAAGYACKNSNDTPTGPTTLRPGNNTKMVIMTSVDSVNSVVIDTTTIFTQDVNQPISKVTKDLELTLGKHTLKTLCTNSDPTFECMFSITFTAHNNDTEYTPSSFSITLTPADGTQSDDFVVSVKAATL